MDKKKNKLFDSWKYQGLLFIQWYFISLWFRNRLKPQVISDTFQTASHSPCCVLAHKVRINHMKTSSKRRNINHWLRCESWKRCELKTHSQLLKQHLLAWHRGHLASGHLNSRAWATKCTQLSCGTLSPHQDHSAHLSCREVNKTCDSENKHLSSALTWTIKHAFTPLIPIH